MKIPIIKIGNSKGILLSKTVMERYGFRDKAEILMKQDYLELKPATSPRQGWDESFRQMHSKGDDKLLFNDLLFNDLPDNDLPEEWK
jgi:antitoxin MazE